MTAFFMRIRLCFAYKIQYFFKNSLQLRKKYVIIFTCMKKEVSLMPNIKSAKKRVLVNKTRAARNKSRNTALKTAIKKANVAAAANAPETEALVKEAVKKVDQAAAKGLIHKNNAAHKKAALAKLVK